ncbi:MAG: hypothetical protein ACI9D0_000750, partial [Bacteroidia bacterium]
EKSLVGGHLPWTGTSSGVRIGYPVRMMMEGKSVMRAGI